MTTPTTDPVEIQTALFHISNVWMLLATFLVFLMHLGFAFLEAGLVRAKNVVNILFKNVCVVALGLLTYAAVGFGIMYPGSSFEGAWFGFAGFGLPIPANGLGVAYADGAYTYWTDFLFQGMFAATCATIVSGAVAERVKLWSFVAFTVPFVALVYPAVGMWHWGGGWLAARGFHDFAGSTVVHGIGGWGALAGAWILGPRLGKYTGHAIRPIMGHNLAIATAGMFVLWFGWYGFNGGSVLSADPAKISYVCVTTSLAAAAGVITAGITTRAIVRKDDLTMLLNGALGGLVGVTAGADVLSIGSAALVGGVAGIVVVCSVIGLDRARLDDPVGAISVHLVCGIWGTLAVGIFADGKDFGTQLLGVLAVGAVTFPIAAGLLLALKKTVGLRVGAREELRGLDIAEHGQEAYAGFQIFSNQ